MKKPRTGVFEDFSVKSRESELVRSILRTAVTVHWTLLYNIRFCA